MSVIFWPGDTLDNPPIGGKARALLRLHDSGMPVPPWFVVTPEAFEQSLGDASKATFAAESDYTTAIDGLQIAPSILQNIHEAMARLCPGGEHVAVRSSASDEDGAEHSFAGQLESYLFVDRQTIERKILAVWRSGFSERILAYRRERNLPGAPHPPAVLVQRMVDADAAGVAFGADPVTGRRGVAIISAVVGLGTALVSGEADADTFAIDRAGTILSRQIAHKRSAHRMDPSAPEGVRAEPIVEGDAEKPAITDEQTMAVANLARSATHHFGCPQDIEWAIEKGRLYLLQSRPITSLASMPDPDGIAQIFDNSNIAESYSGVTTPLTFSFARTAYEGVYREFCRLMKVPPDRIADSGKVFRNMLGLVRGRVYYNLLNWYRLLAMLPGFSVNRRFMEQMMGVKQELPADFMAEFKPPSLGQKLRDGFRLLRAVGGLIRAHFGLSRRIRKFFARLKAALLPGPPPLEDQRIDELAATYRRLERDLLTRWDAPLVNDFLAMIFYGTLRKLTAKWCTDTDSTLQNGLLCAEGGIISTMPAKLIREMAEETMKHEGLVDLLCEGSHAEIERQMPAKLRTLYIAYLDMFADRCLEELKLESPTLRDDPTMLLRSIGQLGRRLREQTGGASSGETELQMRREAEATVKQRLTRHPIQRWLFKWVLKNARHRVRDRENLRFERTRVFGRVRRIFVEIGKRLYAAGKLDDPRDVFYLELEEILGFVEGTATCTGLRALASLRKVEFAAFHDHDPADRFETRGAVYLGNSFRAAGAAMDASQDGQERKGIGCCPGIMRGRVRVIRDPKNARIEKGQILVASRTDPGWIMLFPAAAGVLVEHGSLLSHSAIVCREMGIPAVISIPGLLDWLADGDEVEFDGQSGIVRRRAAHAD